MWISAAMDITCTTYRALLPSHSVDVLHVPHQNLISHFDVCLGIVFGIIPLLLLLLWPLWSWSWKCKLHVCFVLLMQVHITLMFLSTRSSTFAFIVMIASTFCCMSCSLSGSAGWHPLPSLLFVGASWKRGSFLCWCSIRKKRRRLSCFTLHSQGMNAVHK